MVYFDDVGLARVQVPHRFVAERNLLDGLNVSRFTGVVCLASAEAVLFVL